MNEYEFKVAFFDAETGEIHQMRYKTVQADDADDASSLIDEFAEGQVADLEEEYGGEIHYEIGLVDSH